MSDQRPIGIFDSGVGGTSIWKEIHQLLPNENTIYLADSQNAPYGLKNKNEILELCIKNVDFLINQNCKIIVVACNTATTNAIKELRAKYTIPFIGIEPAIKPAAFQTKTNTIGILATKGTLNSELFHQSILSYTNTKIHEQIGHGLVELIEKGDLDSEEMNRLLTTYLQPMIDNNIDYLVLGCSHYPYIINTIKKILPETITIIDSGEAVAKQTKKILESLDILNTVISKKELLFYSNSSTDVLKSLVNNNNAIVRLKSF